jgi:hypothetical protein
MKLGTSSSGCETRPAKGEPARAGSRPGDGASNGLGDAEVCERAGPGAGGPETSHLPGGRGAGCPCRQQHPLAYVWARRGVSPAGCSTRARTQRTAQAPGRPAPLLDPSRSGGEPVPRLRRTTRWCAHVSSAQHKRWHRGRPRARGTGAVADGGREAEGCIRAWTSGNGGTPGPGRAQAARVEVSFSRAPCPRRGHGRAGHRNV